MSNLTARTYASELIASNPSITPQEMMHNLHCNGYSEYDCIEATCHFFPMDADPLCAMSVLEFKHPLIAKDALRKIFLDLEYPEKETDDALAKNYPTDCTRYAVHIGSGSAFAQSNTLYNVGTGDFTVEAWIKPEAGGGTIISRKSGEGGSNYGGFLLVLKSDGTIKLATDDGFGFYEINSIPVPAFDGRFHHVLGLRRSSVLELYFDFIKINATVRTNRFANLNINNSMRLALGFTDQWQEQYNHYSGTIGEVRLWNKTKTYAGNEDWINTDYISSGCVGMWAFDKKSGEDYSATGNAMGFNNVTFVAW